MGDDTADASFSFPLGDDDTDCGDSITLTCSVFNSTLLSCPRFSDAEITTSDSSSSVSSASSNNRVVAVEFGAVTWVRDDDDDDDNSP